MEETTIKTKTENTENNFNDGNEVLIDVMDNKQWGKSQTVEFTVKFNGDAVELNEMDADELATSLLGISMVLEEANTILNGRYSKMFVKVRSSHKPPASFIIDIASFFTSESINAFVNIPNIIGFTSLLGGALIWLFKRTKGEPVLTKKEVEGNNYEITVNNSDNPIIINGDVLTLYESASVRKGLVDMVYPLKNEGISDITFLENEKEREKILRDEQEYFSLLDTESVDIKEDIDYFLITQSNFEGKQTGWRVSFGYSTVSAKKTYDFPVRILDNDFLQEVKEGKRIISNDGTIIKARYRKEIQKLERLRVNWEILEVLEIEHTGNKHTLKRFFPTI
ncbi:MAG TPA: hypothetical protein VMW67_08330 [Desulfobacteria bacterium]|nr:hypothetical protein [Desulfobacteria bacterium]